jgi:hypothetical protein
MKCINPDFCDYYNYEEEYSPMEEIYVKIHICSHPDNNCGMCEKINIDDEKIKCPYFEEDEDILLYE